MARAKKVWLILLSVIMAMSFTVAAVFAADDGAPAWTENTSIDLTNADENGWVTNYVNEDQHTTAHEFKNGLSYLTQATGGPAYNANDVYPLIAAGKTIEFTVDRTKAGAGGGYIAIMLLNENPDPYDGWVWNTAGKGTVWSIIANDTQYQAFAGISGAAGQLLDDETGAASGSADKVDSISLFIAENAADSYLKINGITVRPNAQGQGCAVAKSAFTAEKGAYIAVMGVNTPGNTLGISSIGGPVVGDLSADEVDASAAVDVTAAVSANGTVKLSMKNRAGKIVNVPAEYFSYADGTLTIKKELFAENTSIIPDTALFFVQDDYGYTTFELEVSMSVWTENTTVVTTPVDKANAAVDQNGWMINYASNSAIHCTNVVSKDGMTTMDFSSGGPAYNVINLMPAIKAGKEITFTVDNSLTPRADAWLGFCLVAGPAFPYKALNPADPNDANCVASWILASGGMQFFKANGSGGAVGLPNVPAVGVQKVTIFIGENMKDSYIAVNGTKLTNPGNGSNIFAGDLGLNVDSFGDATEAYLVVQALQDTSFGLGPVLAPEVSDVSETSVSMISPVDVTAAVVANGDVKLAMKDNDGKVVDVPTKYYSYADGILTIKKEMFSDHLEDRYIPLEATFFVIDDYGYMPFTLAAMYEFDANGWLTSLYNGGNNQHGTLGANGAINGYQYLVDGYSYYAHSIMRAYNSTQLDVTKPISFEFAVGGDTGNWSRLFLFDYNMDETTMANLDVKIPGGTSPVCDFGLGFKNDYTKIVWNSTEDTAADAKVFDLSALGYTTPNDVAEVGKKIAVRIEMGETETKIYFNGKLGFTVEVDRDEVFPSGYAKLALMTQGGTQYILSDFNNPVIEEISTSTWRFDTKGDIELTIAGTYDLSSAKNLRVGYAENARSYAKQNANATTWLEEGDYAVDGNQIIVKSAVLETGVFPQNTLLKVETEDGISTVAVTVQNGLMDYIQESDAQQTVSFPLDNDLAIDMKFEGVTEGMTVTHTYTNEDEAVEIPAESYAFAAKAGAEQVYTLSIDKEYFDEMDAGVYTFTVTTFAGSLQFTVYLKPSEAQWMLRSERGTIESKNDGAYYEADLVSSGGATKRGIISWSEGLSLDKPITLPFRYPMGNSTWVCIGLMSSPYYLDFWNENSNFVELKAIMQPSKDSGQWQSLGGNYSGGNNTDVKDVVNTVNMDTLEIYIDDQDISKNYIKINGTNVGASIQLLRKDFPDGKLYISFYNGNVAGGLTLGTPDGVTVKDVTDKTMQYTLGSEQDLTFELMNQDGAVNVYGGDGTLIEGTTLSGNTLSIPASYFDSYKTSEVFVIEDENSRTQVTVTYSVTLTGSSEMQFISEAQDVTVSLGNITAVDAVLYNEKELSGELWSFADGTLTLKSANFTEKGEYTFVAAAAGGYIPVFVSYRDYENGGIKLSGEGSVTYADEVYTVKNGVSYLFAKRVDLGSKFALSANFISMEGTLTEQNPSISETGYNEFVLRDIYGGYEVVVRLYQNQPANEGLAYKVYLTYSVRQLVNGSWTEINSGYRSVRDAYIGENTLTFSLNQDGNIVFAYNEAIEVEIDLSATSMKTDNLMLYYNTSGEYESESAVSFNVEAAPDPVQLGAPVLTVNDKTVTWNAVANASGYQVYVNGEKKGGVITDCTFMLDETAAGTYQITVKAIGDGELYLDSAESEAKSIVIEDSGKVNPPDEGGCNCSSFASAGGGILLAALLLGASFFFLKKKKN